MGPPTLGFSFNTMLPRAALWLGGVGELVIPTTYEETLVLDSLIDFGYAVLEVVS